MSHPSGNAEGLTGHQGARPAVRRRLWLALALVLSFAAVEAVGGVSAGSLALLADAGHMLTDAAAIGLAVLAAWLAGRPASAQRTFGLHRTEVLAALANALGLWAVAGWVFVEALRRVQDPPEVRGGLMLAIGATGLAVNIATALVLRRYARGSLNVEGAFLHVLSDLLGSIAVVVGGVLVMIAGWSMADPVLGAGVGVLVMVGSTRLLWKASHVLMEGTPASLDIQRLCRRLEQVEGVTGVHDIHAWSITTGYEVMSTHVTTALLTSAQRERLLQRLRQVASAEFGIAHVTVQLEDSGEGCPEAHHIQHPPSS